MLISALLFAITSIIQLIFYFLPTLPDIPVELSTLVSDLFDLIFDNAGLVGFFIPIGVVKIALPIAVIIINFEHIYGLIIWVLKKIPMLSIE